jgi:fumarate reductase flavoprotein subunit
MNPGKTSQAESFETEIVIVGGGGTGLAAAVAAAESGAKVMVLEKRRAPGGNSVFPGGLFAAESPVQKRLMIDARKDDLFKIAMDYSHYKINPRIIRTFINKSGDTIRWLEEKGVKFDSVPHLYPNQVPRTWHCPKGGGAYNPLASFTRPSFSIVSGVGLPVSFSHPMCS